MSVTEVRRYQPADRRGERLHQQMMVRATEGSHR